MSRQVAAAPHGRRTAVRLSYTGNNVSLESKIEFLLDQQAASQARFDAQMDEMRAELRERAKHAEREIELVRRELRRAVRLSVEEARAERKRRREADDRLAAGQEDLRKSLQAFIDSMRQGRNGHDKN